MDKMCTDCGLVKEMPVDFDVDDHNMTGYTAKCKECRGTLPVVKPKRVYKRRSSRRAKINHTEAVEPSLMTPDVVESVADPVVEPADENIENDS